MIPRAVAGFVCFAQGSAFVFALFLSALVLHWPSWLLKGATSTPSDFQISAAALFLTLGFIRSSELPNHTTFMLRCLGVTLAAFSLAQVMPHDLANLSSTEWLSIVALPYLAVIGAIIGWFRPAFLIIPICAASWYRFAFASKAGFAVAWGEELTLQESCLFILVGALAVAFLSRASTTIRRNSTAIFATLLLAACAIHFGNYFHSAVAKLRLDGGVFDWLMTNRTYLLLASAEGIGTNVFNGSGLEQWIFNAFRSNILLVNFVTIATQFAAILAIPFVIATRVMLMIYDVFHISIGVSTGIFFYLWISMNVAFTVALGYLTATIGVLPRISFALMTLLSAKAFTIFEAGWYETHAYNRMSIIAVTDDGQEARVSPRVFGFYSYYFYSDYVLGPKWKEENAFQPAFYGTTYKSALRKDADACKIPSGTAPMELAPFVDPAVRFLHQGASSTLWPSAIKFPPYHFLEDGVSFKQVDKARIVAYRFDWQARCIVETPTGYTQNIIRSDSKTVSVKQ